MTTTVNTATAADGGKFNITRFVPLAVQQSQDTSPPRRAVVYAFGGGLVAGSVAVSYDIIANFAEQTATQVFAPHYRLAPENPYPAALDDVYTCITWLQAHAVDSAGGTLTAAAALKARDEGLNRLIAAQVLRYPTLDDQTQMDPQDPRLPFLTWSPSSNTIAWKAYLGKIDETQQGSVFTIKQPRSTPGRADDLHSLLSAYLSVGGLDLFRDETVSFAAGLSSHDIKVYFDGYSGVPHGFDFSPAFSQRLELWGNEARFIQQF